MDSDRDDRRPPIRAAAGWDELLLICRKCVKRQARAGSGRPLRKELKRRLKAQAGGPRVRVVDCGCLDLCPKHGITVARGGELATDKPLRVLRNGDDLERVIDWLRTPPDAAR
ncbi:(2Fe-2S) ferredoxin domain-containing protein [Solimonas soli]|uniref:(2Fe-2S) ferredoxin domain-containing protein n=1 Tax=Solimonas soli TaxID=413479 RepID=UPI0004B8B515|nr:(2Fe-2S) ferredoxin domain-containing protein [Solimonas soli]